MTAGPGGATHGKRRPGPAEAVTGVTAEGFAGAPGLA